MLLHSLLQEYLVENDYLPFSTAGHLTIYHAPARLQEADNTLLAPTSQVVFSEEKPSEADMQKLILFIANRLGIKNSEAKNILEKESISNRLLMENENTFNWPALGLFQSKDGSLHFVQDVEQVDYLPSLLLEKMMRQPVSEPALSVVYAEPETITNDVIFEENERIAKDYWWVWALVIFLLSAMLILFRFA